MAISYSKLFRVLNSRHMLLETLRKELNMGLVAEKNIRNDKSMSLGNLEKICSFLKCRIEDVVEFVPDKKETDSNV